MPHPSDKDALAKKATNDAQGYPGGVRKREFPHWAAALWIFGFTLFVGCSAQVAYILYDARNWRFLAEYFSYALAAFAALSAAITIFDRAKMFFFWLSAISVVAGLILFTIAQGNVIAVWQTSVMMLGAVVTAGIVPLSNFIDRVRGREAQWQHILVGYFFFISLVTVATFLPDVIRKARHSKPSVHLICAEAYKDRQNNSSLVCTEND